jgi:excinuclease ABC subunit B
MANFKIHSKFKPTGDQPQAIEKLVRGLKKGDRDQTLLGVTGSGKTFTMANIVERVQRPTLVLAHNKTLAAQLASEFRAFFPDNAVHYFVSYYDYYQPEAYVPRTDTFIEKDSDINEEIDRLRHAATKALLTRSDTLIVASVSCIYGIGSPGDYTQLTVDLKKGGKYRMDKVLRHLTDIQYRRNDIDFSRGRFRVRGDVLEVFPVGEETALRVEFFGDEVERMTEVDPLTGEIIGERDDIRIFPASHYATPRDRIEVVIRRVGEDLEERLTILRKEGKLLEAQRLEQRTRYDLDMLQETGFCTGIENYSRYLTDREAGEQPATLLDYFPDDFLMFVDESHMTIPQVRGMFNGDRARKSVLVDFGFRLPSALDNRPLTFDEFDKHINQAIYVSATPAPYELGISTKGQINNIADLVALAGKDTTDEKYLTDVEGIAEQVIRPTGLLDPIPEIRPSKGQIDDLIGEIRDRVARTERVLVTTLTKKMAEDLSEYLAEFQIKVCYLHSEIDTLERFEILRDLRLGVYDVVVGINLLREGLDLPEVSLVVILDADKEGFLRSETSLIQTMGRAARHEKGSVIMYADNETGSMQRAIAEVQRRHNIQKAYNVRHKITPQGISKEILDLGIEREEAVTKDDLEKIPTDELARLTRDLERQMKLASENLEFEKAAELRDNLTEVRKWQESRK